MVDNVIKHLPEPIECAVPRVNPDVNHGLWGITIRQDRFSVVPNPLLRLGMLIVGKAAHVWWWGILGNLCLLDFSVNLKLLYKNYSFLKFF